MKPASLKIIGGGIFILGLCFFLLTFMNSRDLARFKKEGVFTTAQVIDVEETTIRTRSSNGGSGNVTLYKVSAQFQDQSGQMIESKTDRFIDEEEAKALQINDTVDIIYAANTPTVFTLKRSFDRVIEADALTSNYSLAIKTEDGVN